METNLVEVSDLVISYKVGAIKEIGLKDWVVQRLNSTYKTKTVEAVKNVSFELKRQEILGLVGVNGSGKSTLLKAISGVLEPTSGLVKVNGKMASLLELNTGFDPDLTISENVFLRGALLGYSKQFIFDKYDEIIEFAELEEYQHMLFKQLSSGMKSRLAFATSSFVEPDLLILDEVLSVGDGSFRKKSEGRMKKIMHSNTATVLVSHSIEQIRSVATRVIWLHKGKILEDGNPEAVLSSYKKFLNI